MNTIESKGFVVVASDAIFGCGWTVDEAITDAREWVEDSDKLESVEVLKYRAEQQDAQMHGALYVAPASAALVDYVSEHGTPNAWGEVNGTLCTTAEEDAAEE